jgi:glutaredoxin
MITLYSKQNCKYCTQAKDLLNARGIAFTQLMMEEDISRDALLAKFPEARNMPIAELEDGETLYGISDILNYVNSL